MTTIHGRYSNKKTTVCGQPLDDNYNQDRPKVTCTQCRKMLGLPKKTHKKSTKVKSK